MLVMEVAERHEHYCDRAGAGAGAGAVSTTVPKQEHRCATYNCIESVKMLITSFSREALIMMKWYRIKRKAVKVQLCHTKEGNACKLLFKPIGPKKVGRLVRVGENEV